MTASLECVVNVSEGRDADVLRRLRAAGGDAVLDVHVDADHHRSVFTLIGVAAPRALAEAAYEEIDLRTHSGAHPRLGAIDVVPFVPLTPTTMSDALAARDSFADWAAEHLGLPCFLYGDLPDGRHRSLPEIRREAFTTMAPDTGPRTPHPTAGAIAVGARNILIAYNAWLAVDDLALARAVAADIRSPSLRALGLRVGDAVQVSMNLIEPMVLGPAEAYDLVAARASVVRAELVGLVPEAVLAATDHHRWPQLDLSAATTIEARMVGPR